MTSVPGPAIKIIRSAVRQVRTQMVRTDGKTLCPFTMVELISLQRHFPGTLNTKILGGNAL
jgi:hypothetical protein